jgi:DNA-binding MarR family transcriptional regulator
MHDPVINQLTDCIEMLMHNLSPKATLEQTLVYLLVGQKDEMPLTDLSERMDWTTLKTSRQVNTLAQQRYVGTGYENGYDVLYTEEDASNRVMKNAFLTHKGKELRAKLVNALKSKIQSKAK